MAIERTVDVSAIIDRPAISGFQYRTLLLCMAVLFMDGYDGSPGVGDQDSSPPR